MKDDLRSEEKSPLERLEGDIFYKRKFDAHQKKSELSTDTTELPASWAPLAVKKPYIEETFVSAFFSKFLWASFAFFLVAVAISGIILLRGSNILSSGNVELFVSGPVAVTAGQSLSLQIAVQNKNAVSIERVKLIVQYPEGSFRKDNPTEPLVLEEHELPAIESGQSINEVANVLVFGEKGTVKTVKVGIEYGIKGSSATLKNEKTFNVNINSSPLTLTVSSLGQVNAGQEFTLSATVISNANVPVKDVMLQASYPYGFTYVSSDPAPIIAQNRWRVGDLAPGERKTITIRGVVAGQTTEDKVFRLSTGTRSVEDSGSIGAVYGSAVQTIAVARPFLGVSLSFNNSNSSEVVIDPGQTISGVITWRNNLPTTLTDTRIQTKLLGSVHDRYSVVVTSGFYRSDVDVISWDKTTLASIDSLNPQDSGDVLFTLKPRPLVDKNGTIIKNPVIGFTISITSRRISEAGVPEEIRNTVNGKVRVNSQVTLDSKVFYYSGPFQNIGPLPPKPDMDTTYTITWTLANTSNDLQNAVVSAQLPTYVTWRNATSPSGENITYDDLSGRVIWRLGPIAAGTGYVGNAPRTVSFQVGLKPSVTQAHSIPNLLTGLVFRGLDIFTGKTVQVGAANVPTVLSDPQADQSQAVVAD